MESLAPNRDLPYTAPSPIQTIQSSVREQGWLGDAKDGSGSEPEGWRREDDHGGEPRGLARARGPQGAPDRPRSPGERGQRPRLSGIEGGAGDLRRAHRARLDPGCRDG